jgi:simple sugar transport system ATP-binding protein
MAGQDPAQDPSLTPNIAREAAVPPDAATAAAVATGEARLELRHISKSFGGVKVLKDVSLQLRPHEVLGLLGDNGAGKSTLIKIITGVHQPDEGEILFDGQAVDALNVPKARDLGVETVFQERALAEQLPLWRNIFMGRPLTGRLGFLRAGEMRRVTAGLMGESMGFTSAMLTLSLIHILTLPTN